MPPLFTDPHPAVSASPIDARAATLAATCQPALWPGERLRVGIDTVDVAGIAASLEAFGDRFERRLFTAHEREAAGRVPARRAERLAARFAAKEAVIKALDLGEAGIGWRDIELCSAADGAPTLQLHGAVAARAAAAGLHELAVSLSHDGGQACAVVVALCTTPVAAEPVALLRDDRSLAGPRAAAPPVTLPC